MARTREIVSSERPDLLTTGIFLGTGTIAAFSGPAKRLSQMDTGPIKVKEFTDYYSSDALLIDPSAYHSRIEEETIILRPFSMPGNRTFKTTVLWGDLRFSNMSFLDEEVPKFEPVLNKNGYVGPVITGGYELSKAITTFPAMGKYNYLLVPLSLEESLEEVAISEGCFLITLKCTKQGYDDAMHNAELYVKTYGKDETNPFRTLVEILHADNTIVAEGHVIIKSTLPFDQFARLRAEIKTKELGKGLEMLYEPLLEIIATASQQLPPSRR